MLLGGGLVAMLGAIVQNRLAGSQAKIRLRLEKLERAYSLCQQVYDGHLREINNAKTHRLNNPSEFLRLRQHPGAEMSELKMIIRCHFSDLEGDLEHLDSGHAPLKRLFIMIENSARSLESISQEHFKNECDNAENYLRELGKASNALKLKLAAKARNFTS